MLDKIVHWIKLHGNYIVNFFVAINMHVIEELNPYRLNH